MTNGGIEDPIALFSPTILEELADKDRFVGIMIDFYTAIAGHHDCYVETSHRRLRDAYDLWREDAGRMDLQMHPDSTTRDHFKDASLIAFWLRRMVPINQIQTSSEYASQFILGTETEALKLSDIQAHFARYGSEHCALFAGFYISLSYEVQCGAESVEAAENVSILGESSGTDVRLPDRFHDEFPMILKTKNISAHGLYMMYFSLFADIRWRVRGALVQ